MFAYLYPDKTNDRSKTSRGIEMISWLILLSFERIIMLLTIEYL